MVVARLRALTHFWCFELIPLIKVEMVFARLRALTQTYGHLRLLLGTFVEMTSARLGALTHNLNILSIACSLRRNGISPFKDIDTDIKITVYEVGKRRNDVGPV